MVKTYYKVRVDCGDKNVGAIEDEFETEEEAREVAIRATQQAQRVQLDRKYTVVKHVEECNAVCRQCGKSLDGESCYQLKIGSIDEGGVFVEEVDAETAYFCIDCGMVLGLAREREWKCRYCEHLADIRPPRTRHYVGACKFRLVPETCGKFVDVRWK